MGEGAGWGLITPNRDSARWQNPAVCSLNMLFISFEEQGAEFFSAHKKSPGKSGASLTTLGCLAPFVGVGHILPSTAALALLCGLGGLRLPFPLSPARPVP